MPSPFVESLTSRLTSRLEQAILSLKQAPVEALLGLVMALIACTLLSFSPHHESMELWARAMLIMYPLLVTLFATTILHRFKLISSMARAGLSLLYLLLAGLYVYVRLDPDLYLTEAWRLLTISVSATAGLALTPLILVRRPARASRDFFWQFNAQILAHAMLSLSFLGALTLGVNVGLFAVDELLGFHVRGVHYARVTIFILVGLLPWQLTTILPKLHREPLHVTPGVRRLGKVLCTYLFLPLMSVYLFILYIYQTQVLMSGFSEAPRNMMSPLVLAAAAMLLAGMLLADQLRDPSSGGQPDEEDGVFLKVSPWLPVLFLPLMPMSAWAVGIRIDQYGLTEFRYLRLLLIVALSVIFVLATIQHLRKKPQPLTSVIATFGALAIMASFGPLSATAVSERSQHARLIASLEEHGLWDAEAHHILPPPQGPGQQGVHRVIPDRAFECMRYLSRNFGEATFERLLSMEDFASLQEEASLHPRLTATHVMHVLRMQRSSQGAAQSGEAEITLRFQPRHQGFAPHAGYLTFVNFYQTNQDRVVHLVHGDGTSRVRLALDESGRLLTFTATDEAGHQVAVTRHELTPLIDYLVSHRQDGKLKTELARTLPPRYRDLSLGSHEGLPAFTVSIRQLTLTGDGDAWRVSALQTVAVEASEGVVAKE